MTQSQIPCYAYTVRHASRHLSQFYEGIIGASGLHAQQFTILAIIQRGGPLSLTALADVLAMDRTTLTRSLQPIERDGYIAISSEASDKRSKLISITASGSAKLEEARVLWRQAQASFEERFGAERAAFLRAELRAAAQAVSA